MRITSRNSVDLSTLLSGSTGVVHAGETVVSSTATQLRAAVTKHNLSRLIGKIIKVISLSKCF